MNITLLPPPTQTGLLYGPRFPVLSHRVTPEPLMSQSYRTRPTCILFKRSGVGSGLLKLSVLQSEVFVRKFGFFEKSVYNANNCTLSRRRFSWQDSLVFTEYRITRYLVVDIVLLQGHTSLFLGIGNQMERSRKLEGN